jgi:Na+-driven multidrug efflux pump
MLFPSVLALIVATLQILLGGGLGLGIWPLPRLGLPGVALAQILATGVSMVAVFLYLVSGRGRVTLRFKGIALRRALFSDIAKPGALACFQPLQTILIAVTFSSLVTRFGTEALAGYSIGQRLEFALIPVAFAVGAAAVPLVGIAIGAGHLARARRVTWTAGAVSFVVLGVIGLSVAIAPDLWAALFANQEKVLASARQYLRLAGPAFGFLGLGLTLFFAQQGSGKVLRPILASTFRLILVIVGGIWLVSAQFPATALFALSGVATTLYGLATAGALVFTRWSPPVATASVNGARGE